MSFEARSLSVPGPYVDVAVAALSCTGLQRSLSEGTSFFPFL